jgi:glycosyltransferase involved in cell wall biosynthesis
MLSILTPAYNEAANLEALYRRIVTVMQGLGVEWEWVIVDDHSGDETFAVVRGLAQADPRVRGVRLARNVGSHAAITCGLHTVHGEAAIMMAADLQDPPETVGAMVSRWRDGARIVWAVRRELPGQTTHTGFARLYYWVMRHVVGMKEIPARGADFFLIDRVAIDVFRQYRERNISVLALVASLGFTQAHVDYDKAPRVAGQSGWTLARKAKLVVDSITAFTDLPIRLCAYAGGLLLLVGLVLLAAGRAVLPGTAPDVVLAVAVVVTLSGLQLLALGVVGSYVWRALDEARRRPQYAIEAVVGPLAPPGS